ncbi:AAA family ATPase [Streptomyces mirabilis]|uniref:AAA family ATPase n=1 Tax=Streptomyces mirabilis TaxID=68239 RepID=UPI0036CF39DF
MVRVALVGSSSFDESPRGEGNPTTNQGFGPLPSIAPAIRRLWTSFGRLDGVEVLDPCLDPTKERLEALWRTLLEGPSGEPVVFHFAGHGLRRGSTLYLPVRDSRSESIPATAIHLNSWLDEVEHSLDAPPVLFMLDVCGGGQAAIHQLDQGIREKERRAWVIAACAENERTYGARFTRAVVRAIDLLGRGYWDLSPAVRNIPLEIVADKIFQELTRLDDGRGYVPTVVHSPKLAASSVAPPFFTNHKHSTDLTGRLRARLDAVLREVVEAFDVAFDLEHFLGKAAGIPTPGRSLSGCLFTGRTDELARIRDWLEGDEPLLVVTGEPGAGKSALIGVTVWLAHPGLQELSTPVLSRVPSEFHPRRRYPTLVGVHARQRTAEEIVRSLSAQLDRVANESADKGRVPQSGVSDLASPAPRAPTCWSQECYSEAEYDPLHHACGHDPDKPPVRTRPADAQSESVLASLIKQLIEKANTLADPVIIVVDAIDESLESKILVDEVLWPLMLEERTDKRPAFRILAGVRPWWDQFGALARVSDDCLIDLDLAQPSTRAAKNARSDDVAKYLSSFLALSPAYSNRSHRESVAQAVGSELVSGHYEGGFLLVTLYASHLSMGATVDASTAVARIPRDLPSMLNLQLETLKTRQPWLPVVLRAIAGGLGQGMPLDLVHAATETFVPSDSTARPSEEDIVDALALVSFYLRTHVDDDGRLYYHFFHQSLTDHFRDDSASGRLFDLLMSTVPRENREGAIAYRWDSAPPYLRAHALEHAAATGNPAAIDRLLLDPRFLLAVRNTLERLPRATSRSARRAARALGRHPSFWSTTPDIGNQSLQLDLVRCGGLTLARHLDAVLGPEAPVLSCRWGTDDTPTGMTACIEEIGTTITAVAIAENDSEAILLIGGADGSVQVWDTLHTDGVQRRYLLPNVHAEGVAHLIAVEIDGQAKAVSYGVDGTAAVIDVGSGCCDPRAGVPGAAVTALAPARELDESVFLAGHVDGTISIVRLTHEGFDLLGVEQSGEKAPVTSLCCSAASDRDAFVQLRFAHELANDADDAAGRRPTLGVLDAETVVTEAGLNGSVRIRDDHGLLYRLEPYDGNVRTVPSGRHFVRVLDPSRRTRQFLASLGVTDHPPEPMRDLLKSDIARVGEVRMALTAHEDGYVRVWDLDLTPRTGLLWHASALFCTLHQAREVVVAVSIFPATPEFDFPATVKVWDSETGAERAELLVPGHVTQAAVAAVGGRLLVLTATTEGQLDIHDVVNECHLHSTTTQLSVTALGFVPYDRGGLAVAGASDGGINLWHITDDTWHHLGYLEGRGQEVTSLSFTSGGCSPVFLATFADSFVQVWSLDDLTGPQRVMFEHDQARRVLTCGEGNEAPIVVTQDVSGRIETWDAADGSLLGQFDGPTAGMTHAAVATVDDGHRLVACEPASQSVRVWDARTGEEVGPPARLPHPPSQILASSTGVVVAFRQHIVAFNWTGRISLGEEIDAVRLTHILSWFPGEILASDPAADAWDLQTWESWTEGEPATGQTSIYSVGPSGSPRLLRQLIAEMLEPEGYDVIELEPGEYEVSVPGDEDGPWTLPLYYVFTHAERPQAGGAGR